MTYNAGLVSVEEQNGVTTINLGGDLDYWRKRALEAEELAGVLGPGAFFKGPNGEIREVSDVEGFVVWTDDKLPRRVSLRVLAMEWERVQKSVAVKEQLALFE
jgi:hypothetical protein